MSEPISGDPKRSPRGMVEPTLGRLDDGRLIVVMRGSSDKQPELPSFKWNGCGYFGTTHKGRGISELGAGGAAGGEAKGRDMRISPVLGAAASWLDRLGVLTEGSGGEFLQAM